MTTTFYNNRRTLGDLIRTRRQNGDTLSQVRAELISQINVGEIALDRTLPRGWGLESMSRNRVMINGPGGFLLDADLVRYSHGPSPPPVTTKKKPPKPAKRLTVVQRRKAATAARKAAQAKLEADITKWLESTPELLTPNGDLKADFKYYWDACKTNFAGKAIVKARLIAALKVARANRGLVRRRQPRPKRRRQKS